LQQQPEDLKVIQKHTQDYKGTKKHSFQVSWLADVSRFSAMSNHTDSEFRSATTQTDEKTWNSNLGYVN
jgi:hypothetical protein